MEALLLTALEWAMAKSPLLVSIFSIMGLLRLIIKPLMTFLGELVIIIPGEKDDKMLDKLKESKWFKGLLYILDYFASVKIEPKKKKEIK